MGSGQSKPIDNSRTHNDILVCQPNSLSTVKPTYKIKSIALRERNGLQTSSQSDASPGFADDKPLRMISAYKKPPVGSNRRGYNSFKEPINRKYPWRGGNEKEKIISLLPKQHSLKPWGPIKGYITSDGSYSSPNESFEKEALKARDVQSRFCHEIHERYAAMTEAEKRRRLEAIKALENKLQHKSGFSSQRNVIKPGSLRTKDCKNLTSSDSSIMGIPKKSIDYCEPVIKSEINAWRVEHLNFGRHRAPIVNNTGKAKVISDRYNEVIRNTVKDVKEVGEFKTGYGKTEVAESEINSLRSCKRRSKAMYVNKMYNYSRLNTLMASGGNYSKVTGRMAKNIMYPRKTSKAVFLLLKTFADKSPSPVPVRHTKSGVDAVPLPLCDRSTSVSRENFNLAYKSVETQTVPVHISRKICLDTFVTSKMDKVPKLEVDHRGSLTRHVPSTTSSRILHNPQQVVLGYCHGVTFDNRKRNGDHGKRDDHRQSKSSRQKDVIDDCQNNDKSARKRMVEENIRQKYCLRDKESIDDRLNNEKFVGRRKVPDRQRVMNHETKNYEGPFNNDKIATRRVAPSNAVRDRPQNGPFSADIHNHLCYTWSNNRAESKSNSANNGRFYAKERYEERDRFQQRTYRPAEPAKSYQNTRQTDTAKEECYRTQQKRCRIPVSTHHRYDHNDGPAAAAAAGGAEKRVVRRGADKENMEMLPEDYKHLCKMHLDLVNGGGDRHFPNVHCDIRNSSNSDDESEDVDRLLCGRRKLSRHWGKISVTHCNVCRERVCYDIKEDEEDCDISQRLT